MEKNVVNNLVKGSIEAFNLGLKIERDRILALIQPHVEVCNFEAVTGEGCDVCFWVKDTVRQIKGPVWKS